MASNRCRRRAGKTRLRLTDGATIITPFGPSQWSSGYGMATDKFGVTLFVDGASTAE